MKTAIRFVIVLGLICLVMGGGVAVLYATFTDRIARQEAEQFDVALRQVLPAGDVQRVAGSPQQADDVYKATDAEGNVFYAARGEAKGYSSTVKVLVGIRADDRTLHRVIVLDQQETPGLGANVSLTRSTWTLWEKIGRAVGLIESRGLEPFENPFLDAFSGRTADRLEKIDAMTAATITSDAVKSGVRQAARRITDAVDKE